MKTAKQWIDESNWSDELKELFWERAGESWVQGEHLSLDGAVSDAFSWSDTPEGLQFWHEVAEGKRTDINRPVDALAGVSAGGIVWERVSTDQEYEALFRKALQSLKAEYVEDGPGWMGEGLLEGYVIGANDKVKEMNTKINDLLKKLEI